MHRVTHKRIVRREDGERVVYEEGDEFEATEAEVSAFGDRLEEVEKPQVIEMPKLDEMTVSEVEEALSTGDYDGVLDRLEEIETDGDDRQGVYDAIDERR